MCFQKHKLELVVILRYGAAHAARRRSNWGAINNPIITNGWDIILPRVFIFAKL